MMNNQWEHQIISALRAIAQAEITDYEAAEGHFIAAVHPSADIAALERELVEYRAFQGRMYGYIREIVYGLTPSGESQRKLELLAQMGSFDYRQMAEVLLDVSTGLMHLIQVESLLIAYLDQRWETSDEAAERKGVNPEVLKRLLRDERRQAAYFPSAKPPCRHWRLRKYEVDAWTPAAVGRPAEGEE